MSGKIKHSNKKLELIFRDKLLKFNYSEWLTYALNEVFIKEDYANLDVKDARVIDIGASVGDTAIYFMLKGAKEVYGYEIDAERYAESIENVNANGIKNIHLSNIAYAPSPADKDSVFKIDCEGCEYGLLKVLSEVRPRQIIMEYHNGSAAILDALSPFYDIGYVRPESRNLLQKLYDLTVMKSKHTETGMLFLIRKIK